MVKYIVILIIIHWLFLFLFIVLLFFVLSIVIYYVSIYHLHNVQCMVFTSKKFIIDTLFKSNWPTLARIT